MYMYMYVHVYTIFTPYTCARVHQMLFQTLNDDRIETYRKVNIHVYVYVYVYKQLEYQ